MKKGKIYLQFVWGIALILTITGLHSCNSCSSKDNEEKTMSYQNIKNVRYHFSFSIPENWSAIDASDNGDGYIIATPDSGVEIKVYGEMIVEDSRSLLNNKTTKEITFNDGFTGKLYIMGPSEILISRSDSLISVNAYINKADLQDASINDQFMKMAKSLQIE